MRWPAQHGLAEALRVRQYGARYHLAQRGRARAVASLQGERHSDEEARVVRRHHATDQLLAAATAATAAAAAAGGGES